MKNKTYNSLKKDLLKDKDIEKAYIDLEHEFSLISAIIKKRIEKGMSQKELADRIGTKQSAISRFESGGYNPTISFLEKISSALDTRLEISLRTNHRKTVKTK